MLTRISVGFNNPIGIDHYEPTNQVIFSVHYSNGSPYNFELVAADGTRTRFSNIAGLTDEVKIACVRGAITPASSTPPVVSLRGARPLREKSNSTLDPETVARTGTRRLWVGA